MAIQVRVHPAHDRFMMGDIYGHVVNDKGRLVHVKMDRSGLTLLFRRADLLQMNGDPY